MANINIDMDATIQGLLETYSDYIGKVLDKIGTRILAQKYTTPAEEKYETEEYYRACESYSFLKSIAADPKKYLYYRYNIVYNGFDVNGKPGVRFGRPSVYDKVEDVEKVVGLKVMYELSNHISQHMVVGYKPEEKWIYYGKEDEAADGILELNKNVRMLGHSDFVRPFMDLRPARKFAVSLYSNRSK